MRCELMEAVDANDVSLVVRRGMVATVTFGTGRMPL
jgi:hypothetical protein